MIKRILKSKDGSISINFFIVFFVMAIMAFSVFVTTFLASYITYDRLITEIEQNLNDAAAKSEKTYLFLSENDKGTYVVDEASLEEMTEDFKTEFFRNLKRDTDDWTISNDTLEMYYSNDDAFSVLHRYSFHIVVKVSLFGKDVGIIEKDVNLNGRHEFSEVSVKDKPDNSGDIQNPNITEPETESTTSDALSPGEFTEDLR